MGTMQWEYGAHYYWASFNNLDCTRNRRAIFCKDYCHRRWRR